MTKPTIWPVRPAKTQISQGIAQSDQSSLCAQWIDKDPMLLPADSEDSDQTGADTQADLSLRWAHRSLFWFCDDVADLCIFQT